MAHSDIEDDIQIMLGQIAQLTMVPLELQSPDFSKFAALLTAFVARHQSEFSFGNFPLPAGRNEVLCSYELNDDGQNRPSLVINAIQGGVNSVVHNHGTWAVIIGIEGYERHCIYRRIDDGLRAGRARLNLECETTVGEGQSLILEEGLFTVFIPTPTRLRSYCICTGGPLTR